MLRLKLRGDTYYVIGQVNGKRIRKTTKTSDKNEANKKRIEIEHHLVNEQSTTSHVSFADSVKSYLKRRDHTSTTTLRYLDRFIEDWKDIGVGQIDQRFLEDWLDERLDVVSGPTVRREVNAFMPVIRHARKRGWIDEVPDIERPADGEPRLRALTADEVAMLKNNTCEDEDVWLLTQFLVNTGARIGEAINLDWSDVHVGQDPYVILRTRKRKGGKEAQRTVPLNQYLLGLLLPISKTDGTVFKWSDQRSAGKLITAYAGELGIEDFRPHDLRRTFATLLLERGVNPRTVADLLGHTSLTMVMRYMVPPSHVKKDAVNSLI